MPGSRVRRKTSASGLSSRSIGNPWLAVIAEMRDAPRSGQITPEPTSRKCGATRSLSICSLVSLVSAKTIQSGRVPSSSRAHLDAADDAVGAGCRRDEQAIAFGVIGFESLGQIDGLRLDRNAHQFDRAGRRQARRERHEHKHQSQTILKARQDYLSRLMDGRRRHSKSAP